MVRCGGPVGAGQGALTQGGRARSRQDRRRLWGSESLKCPHACPGYRSVRPCGGVQSSHPQGPLAPGLSSLRHSFCPIADVGSAKGCLSFLSR